MGKFQTLLMVILLLALTACARPGSFTKSYRQMAEPVGPEDVFMLDPGAKPRLIVSENFDQDFETFIAQDFLVLGESHFAGPEEKYEDALRQGAELGVTHILLHKRYLHQGSKKAYKTVKRYDYVRAVKYRYGTYYMGYEPVLNPISIPYTKQVPIYDQRAVFLVKLKAKAN